MTTFTIDEQNNITAFGSTEEAAATTATPFDSFSSQKELAGLIAGWPAERLVGIWNGLPGVEPVKRSMSRITCSQVSLATSSASPQPRTRKYRSKRG